MVLAALLVGFALRCAIGLTDDAPATDETAYLRSGISLVEGDGYQREGGAELHFPPFVPFLLGPRQPGDLRPPHRHRGPDVPVEHGPHHPAGAAGPADRRPGRRHRHRLGRGPRPGPVDDPRQPRCRIRGGVHAAGRRRGLAGGLRCRPSWGARAWRVFGAGRPGRARVPHQARGPVHGGPARDRGAVLAARRPDSPPAAAARPPGPAPAAPCWRSSCCRSSLASCRTPCTSTTTPASGSSAPRRRTPRSRPGTPWPGRTVSRDSVLYALDETGLRFAAGRSSLATLAREDPAGYLGIVRTNVGELVTSIVNPGDQPAAVVAVAAPSAVGPGGVRRLAPPPVGVVGCCWPSAPYPWRPRWRSSSNLAT